ncbi:kinase-like domain-containing protein [Lophiotrema nucula]|uniref:Kinase-like domain-containing protein n=1 Tax=Lophiotrema nucula TaxID=690887 RepID=A0A6A5YN82_9PLEO|nr:kinase-like domain-containing protein [Lophiotrema nucula]
MSGSGRVLRKRNVVPELKGADYMSSEAAVLKEPLLSALDPESWIITHSILQTSPRRLVLQARITDWNHINIIIEPNKKGDNTFGDRLLHLLSEVEAGCAEPTLERTVAEYISIIRLCCQQRYGRERAPLFLHTVHVTTAGGPLGISLAEKIDVELLHALHIADVLSIPQRPSVRYVSVNSLTPVVRAGSYFLPNTRLVKFEGREYVAKGPIYPSRVSFDMAEMVRMLEFPEPQSPYVVPKPSAVVIVSETDRRVCGFLLPYYRNGNVDVYARKLRSFGRLTNDLLLRWFRQLVEALQYLSKHDIWHGDIKPDNVLVDENENVALTDFTQAFATCATASPEVRFKTRGRSDSKFSLDEDAESTTPEENVTEVMGVPTSWSHERIMRSEVYSLGRTMYLICEGMSMIDIYRTVGWVNVDAKFPTVFGSESTTPECLRPLIIRCVQEDANSRIGLDQLAEELTCVSF